MQFEGNSIFPSMLYWPLTKAHTESGCLHRLIFDIPSSLPSFGDWRCYCIVLYLETTSSSLQYGNQLVINCISLLPDQTISIWHTNVLALQTYPWTLPSQTLLISGQLARSTPCISELEGMSNFVPYKYHIKHGNQWTRWNSWANYHSLTWS